MAKKGRNEIVVEKAVDVMIAVDLVVKAEKDEFDVAYLLSADGDFTPAVEHVRGLGKSVFAVAAGNGAKLAKAVNSFIRVDSQWIDDCLLPSN
ncbi:MAG: NYN domain-containing protein [Acidobacteria bacterium]|nr:NYN domain-containing protein [Acidobacteriota bacterium]